jgi:hypothetical protein
MMKYSRKLLLPLSLKVKSRENSYQNLAKAGIIDKRLPDRSDQSDREVLVKWFTNQRLRLIHKT